MAETVECRNCGGTGGWVLRVGVVECPDCNGKGFVTKESPVVDTVKCLYCNGVGGFVTDVGERLVTCPECRGTGKMPSHPYDVGKGLERFKRALKEKGRGEE